MLLSCTQLSMEMQQLPLLGRTCFICLEEDEQLHSCCTQCFGVAHSRCWRDWRTNQRLSALRLQRQGGGRDPFLCSICKTGRARLAGESVSREWLEVVLHAVVRGRSGEEAETDMFEELESSAEGCCSRKFVLVNVLVSW